MTTKVSDFGKDTGKTQLGLIPEAEIEYKLLANRGISRQTCQRYHYGSAKYRGKPVRVAQYTDASGQVVAQKLRYIRESDAANGKFLWLGDPKAKSLFGLDRMKGTGRQIVITEGEEDAMAVWEAMDSPWWPCVSVPDGASSAFKWLQAKLEALEEFDSIVLCFDEDDPGRKAVKQCLDLFSPGKLKIASLPRKDACEMLQAGESNKLKDAIFSARRHAPEGLVSGDGIWDAIVNGKSRVGEPYPWAGLNDSLKGFRPKELVLLTAATGAGKSTISRHLAEHCLNTGHTVGYVALEESVQQSALGIYGLTLGKALQLEEDLPLTELKEVHDKYGDRLHLFDHFGSTESSMLISKLRFLVKGLGCDVVCLDHITIAISGLAIEDERKAIDKMMTDLRSLVEQTEVTLFVISHLKRPKEGSHEEGKAVRISDLRGSQSLGQLPDVIIAAERNQQSEDPEDKNTIKIRVLKNRPVGITGIAAALRYDLGAGRLAEVDLEDPRMKEARETFE